ncbi:MAG: hypothetical protein ACHQAX_04075 [Gammaproteobacteria bacterium]
MFSFVSDNGPGIFNSSKAYVDLPILEKQSESASRASINANVLNGNLHIQQEDLVLSGIGLDTHLKRYYNSQAQGNPWQICGTSRLTSNAEGEPSLIHADGTLISFHETEDDIYVSYAGNQGEMRLTQSDGQWCLETVSTGQRQYFYYPSGYIHFETNALNGRLDYIYNNNTLVKIRNASGQEVDIIYDNPQDENRRVQRIEVEGQVYVGYHYDDLKRLDRVTYYKPETNDQYHIRYTYEGDSQRINSVTEDDGHVLTVVFEGNQLKTVFQGERQFGFQYRDNCTTVNHNNGQRYEFEHTEQRLSQFAHVTATGTARISHHYSYNNPFGYLSSDVGSDDTRRDYQHDEHGWVFEQTQRIDAQSTETKRYARNEQGQVTSETLMQTGAAVIPAAYTIYAPNNFYQPRFKVTGEGQVTEYIYDEHKQLNREYRYRNRYTGNDVTYDVLNAWANQPSQKYQSELIAYDHNEYGDVSATKRYSELNPDGSPNVSYERVQRQETDMHGRVIGVPNHKNANQPKRYTFDAIGRKVASVNFFNHHTISQYAPATDHHPATLTIQYPSGLTVVKSLGKVGEPLKEEESGSINGEPARLLKTTDYHYDKNMLYCVDEHDHLTNEHRFQYIQYNSFNRPSLEIDQDGYATSYVRDDRGNAVKTIQYSFQQISNLDVRLSLQALSSINLKKDPLKDRVRDTLVDDKNRIRYTINARGFITEHRYGPTGHVSTQIEYAKTLQSLDRNRVYSLQEMSALIQTEALQNDPENRISYHYDDSDGFEVLTIQPNGGVLAYTRDPQGNITKTERFANPLRYTPDALPATAAEVRAAIIPSPEDIVEHAFYNKCNDNVASIDGEGYAKEAIFDNEGDKEKEIKYAKKSQAPLAPTPWSREKYGLNDADADNESSTFVHDAEHRQLTERSKYGDMHVEEYGYWDDPDSVYDHSTYQYSTSQENVLLAKGTVNQRDCRGDVYRSLDSLGLDALLHATQDRAGIWSQYATVHQRDGFRRTARIINNHGNQTQFQYTKRGGVRLTVNAELEKRESIINAFQEVTSEILYVDAQTQAVTESIRDLEGNVIQRIDAEGYVFHHAFNAFDEQTQERFLIDDSRWLLTNAHYHHMGNANEQTQSTFVNQEGELGELIDSRLLFSKEFDVFSCLRSEADALGLKTLYGYDKRRLQTSTRYTQGNDTDESFGEDKTLDGFGRERGLHRFYRRHGVLDEQFHDTVYSATIHERIITSTAHGRTSTRTIRENGFEDEIEVNLGNGQLTQTYVNANSDVTRHIESGVTVEEHAHDTLGRVNRSVNANGTVEKFRYDKIGRQTRNTIINPQIHAAAPYHHYRVESDWCPLGLAGERTYECASVAEKILTQSTRYGYGLRGSRKQKIEDPDGIQRITDYTFDIQRNTRTETLHRPDQAPEREIHHLIDNFARPCTTIIDPHGLKIATHENRDKLDQVVEAIDGIGHKTYYRLEDHGHTKMAMRPSGCVVIEYFNLDMHMMKQVAFTKALSQSQIQEIIAQNYNIDTVTAMLGGESQAAVEHNIYSADELLLRTAKPHTYPIDHVYNNAGEEDAIHQGDHETLKVHDAYGHLAYEIDAENYVTRFIHDKAGNLLLRIRYANKIASREYKTVEAMDAVMAQIASQHDRFDCHQYDMMHREQFTLNAEGLLKQTTYDPQGHVHSAAILDKRFPIPADLTARNYQAVQNWLQTDVSASALAEWVSQHRTETLDQSETHVRDGLRRITATTDGLGYRSAYEHDLSDHVTQEINRLGGITDHRFDKAGRIESTLSPEREVTEINLESGDIVARPMVRPLTIYVHDDANQLKERREAAETPDERITAFEHDDDGNVFQEILRAVAVYDAAADASPNTTGRVERPIDVITSQAHDAFRKVTIRKTSDGAVSYQVYGLHHEVVFSIDPEGYVTHHQYDEHLNKAKVTRYNLPIAPEAFALLQAGTTPEALEPYIQHDPLDDRYIDVAFDKLNRQIRIEEPVELYFDSNATDKEEQYFEVGKETLLEHNAFSEVTLQRKLVNPYEKKYLEDRQYYNRAGDVVAEVNADLYIITYGDFSLQHEWRTKIEFSHPLNPAQLPADGLTSPNELQRNPDKDREYHRVLNGEGLVTEERACDWVVHDVEEGNRRLVSMRIDKVTRHEFDGEQNETATRIHLIQLSDNSVIEKRAVLHFFNAACLKIAQLDTKRVVRQADGTDAPATPLTCFGYNILEDQVMTERSDVITLPTGGTHAERQSNLWQVIVVQRAMGQWHRESYLFGKHGQAIVRFQANGFKVEMSYDALKRIVKEWLQNAYYELRDGQPARLTEQHTTLTRYSLRGYQVGDIKFDREAIVGRFAQMNPFGEVENEGVRYDGSLALYIVPHSNETDIVTSDSKTYYVRNRSGMVIKRNPNGVWEILRVNPVGFVTAQIISQIHHLGQDKFTPKYLMSLPPGEYQYTEFRHSNRGYVTQTTLPTFAQSQNPLFTTVMVGKPGSTEKINIFGQYAAIWQKPTSFQAKAQFKIRRKDSGDPWQDLNVITHGNDMGVNLTAFGTNLYDYVIQFFHITDNLEQNETPYASGRDVLVIVNNNQVNSQHLVLKMETETRMVAAGKTVDNAEGPLTGLQIIPELDPPFYVGVTPREDGNYEVGFDHVPSGTYKARRADISQPVGGPFTPIPMSMLGDVVSLTAVTAIYTEAHTSVTVNVEERYKVETDASEVPEGHPIEQTNHAYRYFMTMELKVVGNPSPGQYAQQYSLEIEFKNGLVERYTGEVDAQGKAINSIMIYEEMVPVAVQHEPPPYSLDAIRSRVDYPVAVKNVTVNVIDHHRMGSFNREAGLNTFNSKPNSSHIQVNFLANPAIMRMHDNAKAKRYIHVNQHMRLASRQMDEAVALKVGDKTIGPTENVDGYQLFDISEANTASLQCQYMGAKPIPESTQKHEDEQEYVDTRIPEAKVPEIKYQTTRNSLVTISPIAYTHYVNTQNPHPKVFCKLPTDLFYGGEQIHFEMDLIDDQGNNARYTMILASDASNFRFDWSTTRASDFYITQVSRQNSLYKFAPAFYRASNPPVPVMIIWANPKAKQYKYVTQRVRITNLSRNILLYDGVPYCDAHSSYKSSFERFQQYFIKEDLTYQFTTQPSLHPDIVSLKVLYEGRHIGSTAIQPTTGYYFSYSADLRNFDIPDKSKLAFQFMSPNLINNYVIENPPFEIRSTVYQRMTVTEMPVNVLFVRSQSMYIKMYTERVGPIVIKKYEAWAGKNAVWTQLKLPPILQEESKRVNFKYTLKSKTGLQATQDSGYHNLGAFEANYTEVVHSPEKEEDVNVPAQLLPFPQGVNHYDMDVNLYGTWVNLYSGAPNVPRYFVMIKPLPNNTNRIELYLRQELDAKHQHWDRVTNNNIKYVAHGIAVIDVTSLLVAQCQYRLRAFSVDGQILDLSAFAPQTVDREGFAYGQFTIKHSNELFAQVPPPDHEAEEVLSPVLKATYDFQGKVVSETDAKSQTTTHVYDKQGVRTLTRRPKSSFIKPETGGKLDSFKDEKMERVDARYKAEQKRFDCRIEEAGSAADPRRVLTVRAKTKGPVLKHITIRHHGSLTIQVPMSPYTDGVYRGVLPIELANLVFDANAVTYQTEDLRANEYAASEIPTELIEEVSPETYTFPNAFGEAVGTQDSNGNLFLHVRNDAGLESTALYPDGSQEIIHQSVFGHEVLRIDRTGIETRTTTNPHGIGVQVTRGRDAQHATDSYELECHDKVIKHQNPDGACTLSRLNSLLQVTHSVDPDEYRKVKLFDISGNPLLELFADGKCNTFYRDVFGRPIWHTDRAGVEYYFQTDYAGLPTETLSASQSNRPNAMYDEGIPLPRLLLSHRYHSNGKPYMTYSTPFVDSGTPHLDQSISLYRYEIDGLLVGERFWLNGRVYKDMVVGFSPLNHVSFVADLGYRLDYYEDRGSNIRAVRFMGTDPGNPGSVIEDVTLWYDYNEENQMRHGRRLRDQQGILIESSTYRSTLATYQNGRMVSQRYYDPDKNAWIGDSFRYNDQGYVRTIQHSDARETALTHSLAGLLSNQITRKTHNGQIVEDESTAYTHSPSGALNTQSYRKDDRKNGVARPIFDLRQHTRNNMGTITASQQEIYRHKNDDGDTVSHMTQDLATTYADFKNPVEARVDLKTTFHSEGKTSTNALTLFRNEHGIVRKKVDQTYPSRTGIYVPMPDGSVLYREEGHPNDANSKKEIAATSTYGDAGGTRIIAQYTKKHDENLGRWEVETAIQPFADNPISSQPIVIEVIRDNMTLIDVAKMYCYGRGDFAGWLQQHNPQYTVSEILPIGARITIPYGQKSQHFTAGSTQSHAYAAMLGNTVPSIVPYYVKMPNPQVPWKLLIPVAIGTIVAIVVAPQFAVLFGDKLLGVIAAGAAAGAAGNLSAQATANLMNLADGFDWTQFTTATVMGALGDVMSETNKSILALGEGPSMAKTVAMMQQAAMINIAQQGYFIATGQQDQFQWQNLVASTVMSVTRANLDEHLTVSQSIKDMTNIMLGQVMAEQSRSMQEGNAFRGSNIFGGAARELAMYGVVKATTSAMVRFLQPKTRMPAPVREATPVPEQMPQPKREPVVPTNTNPTASTRRRNESKPAPRTSTSSTPMTPKPLPSNTEKNERQPIPQQVGPRTTQYSYYQEPSLLMLNSEGAQEARFNSGVGLIFSGIDGNPAVRALSRLVAVKEVVFDGAGRVDTGYDQFRYRDTSTTSRLVCAGVGAGTAFLTSAGLHAAVTTASGGPLSPVSYGTNYLAAPHIVVAAKVGGDASQQVCHNLFKMTNK